MRDSLNANDASDAGIRDRSAVSIVIGALLVFQQIHIPQKLRSLADTIKSV